jgi:hypothetical protein
MAKTAHLTKECLKLGAQLPFELQINKRLFNASVTKLAACQQCPTKPPKVESLKDRRRYPIPKQLTNGSFASFRSETCLSAPPNLSDIASGIMYHLQEGFSGICRDVPR